jgi:hypothetical protein
MPITRAVMCAPADPLTIPALSAGALGADVGRLVRAAAILLRAGPKRSSSQTAFTAGALNVG